MDKALGQVAFDAGVPDLTWEMWEHRHEDWERIAQAVIDAHEAAQVKPWPPPDPKDGDAWLAYIPWDNVGWIHAIFDVYDWFYITHRLFEKDIAQPTHYRPMPPKPEGI